MDIHFVNLTSSWHEGALHLGDTDMFASCSIRSCQHGDKSSQEYDSVRLITMSSTRTTTRCLSIAKSTVLNELSTEIFTNSLLNQTCFRISKKHCKRILFIDFVVLQIQKLCFFYFAKQKCERLQVTFRV